MKHSVKTDGSTPRPSPQPNAIDHAAVAKALGAHHVFTLTEDEKASLRTGRTPPRVAESLRRSRTEE